MKITVIDTQNELTQIQEIAKTERFLLFPVFNDNEHPILANPVLVLAKPLKLDELYIIGISHHECLNIPFDFSIFDKPYIYGKKYFDLQNSLDIDSVYYVSNKEYTINLFESQADWQIYPIYKMVDELKDILNEFSQECLAFDETGRAFRFLNEITIPSLAAIERNGLKVDNELFTKSFELPNLIKDSFVYTQYNYLTTTGRPSSRYGGVNYSALNKANESRKCFTSRFENGNLFMLDYDSYHLRLIAKLINYNLPEGSVHEHLAKQYFNTDVITQELYDESKKISFRLLYGGVDEKYKGVKFFADIQLLIDRLWGTHQKLGFAPTIISNIHMQADSKTKLFNYIIQNYETEQNMLVLKKIFKETTDYKSVPILYTYDSILFDVKEEETENYLNIVKTIMELNGDFPVKVASGKNYNDLVKI